MMTGTVDPKLIKKPTGNPLADLSIKQCILNSTGMVSPWLVVVAAYKDGKIPFLFCNVKIFYFELGK